MSEAAAVQTQLVPDLGQIVTSALDDELRRAREGRGSPKSKRRLYASEWHPCRRKLYLDMKDPASGRPYEVEALRAFHRGDQREADIKADLEQAGKRSRPPFEMVGAGEAVELTDRQGRIVITGRIDFSIRFERRLYPFDYKSWPSVGQRVFTADDLEHSPFTRGAEMQLLIYMYAQALEDGDMEKSGYLLIDLPSEPRPIRIDLADRLEKVERFLTDAELSLDAIDNDDPPAMIQDVQECRRCRYFRRSCPGFDVAGAGAVVFTDEQIISDVAREAQLKAFNAEYEGLHKKNVERFRGVTHAIVGNHLVVGEEGSRHYKEKPATPAKDVKTWSMRIVPLGTESAA
ncbi:MAG TPA: PD-(D/E)XK nuclease family protein [Candidatus Polarisedimenticolia bacterium]|jgi:CRISPR/Cas system-associated exonuclease Cas4 (RecB family)